MPPAPQTLSVTTAAPAAAEPASSDGFCVRRPPTRRAAPALLEAEAKVKAIDAQWHPAYGGNLAELEQRRKGGSGSTARWQLSFSGTKPTNGWLTSRLRLGPPLAAVVLMRQPPF